MYHSIRITTTCSRFANSIRCISTSLSRSRNIRNLEWDDIGTTKFKEMRKTSKDPALAYQDYGDRKPGITKEDGTFEVIPEMIPELVVPDLTGFNLKPYVSFCAPDVKREEFTAEYLFNAVYKSKIVEDFKNDDLTEDGKPKNPTMEENLSAEDALLLARRTGTDLFAEDPEEPDRKDIRYW